MFVRWMIRGLSSWLLLAGFWGHDWRMILASVATAVIYPLVTADLDDPVEVPVCAGCLKGRIVPGCPVHDPGERKAAA